LTIDLAEQTLLLPGGEEVGFPIDSFAKECLLNGVDELGYLLGFADRIAAYEHSA
jgi:3-isopropylmalate/(R)-2-methylmalate dehydratase small subunit